MVLQVVQDQVPVQVVVLTLVPALVLGWDQVLVLLARWAGNSSNQGKVIVVLPDPTWLVESRCESVPTATIP